MVKLDLLDLSDKPLKPLKPFRKPSQKRKRKIIKYWYKLSKYIYSPFLRDVGHQPKSSVYVIYNHYVYKGYHTTQYYKMIWK